MKWLLSLLLLACSASAQFMSPGDPTLQTSPVESVAAPGVISYGGEIARYVMNNDNPLTNSITISNAVPQNGLVVVVFTGGTTAATNVTDAGGNTYTLDVISEGATKQYIASAKATTALASNDVIKVRFSTSAYTYRTFSVNFLTNQAASSPYDSGVTNANVFNINVTCTANTVADRTITLGSLYTTSYATHHYTPGAGWAWINEATTNAAGYGYAFVVKTNTSAGSLNMGGSLEAAGTWYALWSGYK